MPSTVVCTYIEKETGKKGEGRREERRRGGRRGRGEGKKEGEEEIRAPPLGKEQLPGLR